MRVGFSTIILYAGSTFGFGYRKSLVEIGTGWAISILFTNGFRN